MLKGSGASLWEMGRAINARVFTGVQDDVTKMIPRTGGGFFHNPGSPGQMPDREGLRIIPTP
jgi:hypothetical protein